MDLRLDLQSLTSPGRKPSPLSGEPVRGLRPEDLLMLAGQPPQPMELKKIGERHHALARALASGLKEGEAAALVGYDPSRVSVLKANPAFRELLDLYRDNADAQFMDFHARLAGVAKDAIGEVHRRLEEAPEEIGLDALLNIVKMGADRTGHGPSTKQDVTVNINLAERLESARKRALEAQYRDITPQAEAAE